MTIETAKARTSCVGNDYGDWGVSGAAMSSDCLFPIRTKQYGKKNMTGTLLYVIGRSMCVCVRVGMCVSGVGVRAFV